VSDAVLLAAILATPPVGALAVSLLGRRPDLREAATLAASAGTFGLVLVLLSRFVSGGAGSAGGAPGLELLPVMPGLVLAFEVEPLGMLFAMVASGLWLVTSVYAIGYMRGHHESHQTRFFACFALSIGAALGIALSRNLFTLFVFYEMLTLSTYPLVTHKGTEKAMRAGRVYLGVLLSTSVGLFLLALIWTWSLAGTLEFARGGLLAGHADEREVAILLLLFAFGTGKAALMPFHRWLPAAMVAPAPVSALLHAVAVVKAGVFTVLKIVVYVFGLELLGGNAGRLWLSWIAAATLLIASLVAMTKDNLKARLAYSTVSQLSYIVLGAALATPAAVLGAGMHIAMHALGKITLFFCAGAIDVAAHKTEISDMRGIGRAMPVTLFAFAVGSLSIIGLPPLGGSWSKWLLMLGAAEAGQRVMIAVLMVSSLLNVAYLMPIVVRGFFPGGNAGATVGGGIREAPALCVVPLCLTAAGCVIVFFGADAIFALLRPLVEVGP
jgi:multicomponent Na+:H+ antiporter subunit D